MKLELDLWFRLLDACVKFEIDICKHVEKKPGKLKKSKTRKNNRQNSENKIFEKKTERMSRSIQLATYIPNLKDLSWFMSPWLHKMSLTYFWL